LAELWLGHHQRLGSGDPGSVETTRLEADRHGVRIMRLPPVEILPHMNEVRKFVSQGKVIAAARLLGRQPRRARVPLIEVAWAPGVYSVQGHRDDGRTILLELALQRASSGMSAAPWPDVRYRQITFISGPGDGGSEAVAAD
jgi:hypothetical protein